MTTAGGEGARARLRPGATTPARTRGSCDRPRQSAGPAAEPDAAASRHRTRRDLPIREQGRRLGAGEQLQHPTDVLQPASRRSEQRQGGLRGGPSGREVARRRQDVRDPRHGWRARRAGARRPARDLDRSEEPEAHHDRQRRRAGHQLGPGQDVGLREHDGDVARLLGQRGHATTLLRLHGPPGQRQLGRAERHAQHATGS